MKNLFLIISILCSATAVAKETTYRCPAGLFCTNGGTYTSDEEIPAYIRRPSERVVPGWGDWREEGLCDTGRSTVCWYVATDYDEVWVSTFLGFYTVKNGNVSYVASGSSLTPGVFACPGTYPSSDIGASSVLQCYRTASNGQKDYYKPQINAQPGSNGGSGTDDVNAVLKNLQSAIDQAKIAEQNLQSALAQAKALEQNLQTGIKQSNNVVAGKEVNTTTSLTEFQIRGTNSLDKATQKQIDVKSRKGSQTVGPKNSLPSRTSSKAGSAIR